ncbi:MAG: FRG domain-containing protein [Isosphaeraceae bacterium]
MSEIRKPTNVTGKADSVAALLSLVTKWHTDNQIFGANAHRSVWYRGHSKRAYLIEPGVYRAKFTQQAQKLYGKNIEERRLNLEREILSEFRTSGAALLNPEHIEEMYFIAQHYGIPTRLLDWTMNPLAALFFAACSSDEDGDVFVIDAKTVIPVPSSTDAPKGIITMRHPFAVDAIRSSFWIKPQKPRPPMILPIRPDNLPGRIGQQSSCFTLHMRDSTDCTSATLGCFVIIPRAVLNETLTSRPRAPGPISARWGF